MRRRYAPRAAAQLRRAGPLVLAWCSISGCTTTVGWPPSAFIRETAYFGVGDCPCLGRRLLRVRSGIPLRASGLARPNRGNPRQAWPLTPLPGPAARDSSRLQSMLLASAGAFR
jgi:hypothetical protein